MTETRLTYLLTLLDGHVRFGEAKNGALLVAAGGMAAAAATPILTDPDLSSVVVLYLSMVWALGVVAAVIAVVSFLPRTRLPWLGQLKPTDATDNLAFFGHIQKYDAETYWRAVADTSLASAIPPFEFCLAEQVVINARIAARKFTLFKYGAWTVLAAFLTPLGAWLLSLYIRDPDS